MREKLKSFQKDYLRITIAITNTLLAVSMFFSPEPRNFFFWFAFGFRVITVPVALFVGNKGLWAAYFIFCNIKGLDPNYNNLVVIGIISVLFALLPKVNRYHIMIVSAIYITDIFLIAELYHRSGFYIYSTLLLCLQYVMAMWKQRTMNKTDNRILILTPDEIAILNQLKEDDVRKGVEGYSESTVYRKLSAAKDRNGMKDNDELISYYKASTIS